MSKIERVPTKRESNTLVCRDRDGWEITNRTSSSDVVA